MSAVFRPHPLLTSGHAMTIAGAFASRNARPPTTVTTYQTEPATSVVALCSWQPDRKKHPALLLLHGLTGHADAPYMRGLASKAFERGYSVVRLNMRNCGETEHLTPTLYHSGLTSDARFVLHRIEEETDVQIFVAGYSMGGNVALKLLGELGDQSRVAAVAAVSPPIDLAAASASIDRGWVNAIYQRTFLRSLRSLVRRKGRPLHPTRSLREFDDRYIAPDFGFADADDYYARASAGPYLGSLAVPTLVIHAEDDSIIPMEAFRRWQAQAKAVRFLLPRHGGHAAFIGRGRTFWAEDQILDFFSELRDVAG